MSVIRLDSGLALIFEHGIDYLHSVCNGEVDAVALLPSLGIERACSEENAYHVECASFGGVVLPHVCAVLLLTVLLHVYLTVGISVESLVYGIAVALTCSLTEVERFKLCSVITEQRVAHAEELVGICRCACDERGTIGRFAMIPALYGRHCKLPIQVPVPKGHRFR